MLQSMRGQAKSWVMVILFGLLILSFAVWGIGDIFRNSGRETVVASVADQEISSTRFIREYQQELQQVQARLRGRIDAETLARLGLGDQVLQRMIDRVLLNLASKNLGIVVPDEVVARTLRANAAFRQLGAFSAPVYRAVLARNGMTPTTYEASLRRDIAGRWFIEAISAVGSAPKSLLRRLYDYRGERRVVQLIHVPNKDRKVSEPDQVTLEAYHKKNAKRFMAPEYRAVSAIVLRPQDFMAGLTIPEARLREEYENRKDEFAKPGRRTIEQLLFANAADAKKAAAALASGKTFAEVAKDPKNLQTDIALGTMTRKALAALVPEVVDAVFKLPKGGHTAPIKSALGWHILQVTAVTKASTKSFAEVKDDIAKALKRERAIKDILDLADKVEDALSGGATPAEVGKTLGVKVIHIAALDAKGNGLNGKPVKAVPRLPKFLRTAFATQNGEESDRMEENDGSIFILKVESVTPPAVRPLKDVRAQVAAAWKRDKRALAAKAEAKRLAERVKSGQDMDALAKETGLDDITTSPFTRDGKGPGGSAYAALPPGALAKVFAAKKDDVVVVPGPEGWFVARVKEILPSDPKTAKDDRKRIGDQLVQGLRTDLVAQFSSALRLRYPVEINRTAVQQALQPGAR